MAAPASRLSHTLAAYYFLHYLECIAFIAAFYNFFRGDSGGIKLKNMKKSLFAAFYCALFLQIMPATAAVFSQQPEVKVIVSPRRIWLVADEMPVKNLQVQIFNAAGKIMVDQKFSSKTADWSLDVTALPAGSYTVVAGSQAPVHFRK